MGDHALSMHVMNLCRGGAPVCGRLASLSETGQPFVTFAGIVEPIAARSIVSPAGIPDAAALANAEVLLVFEEGDWTRPIIVGFVSDRLLRSTVPPRLVLEARDELQLRCGDSTVSLAQDGRVVVKGTRLTSRATEYNKIRGAVVLIN
jgi:hypothetical protein